MRMDLFSYIRWSAKSECSQMTMLMVASMRGAMLRDVDGGRRVCRVEDDGGCAEKGLRRSTNTRGLGSLPHTQMSRVCVASNSISRRCPANAG